MPARTSTTRNLPERRMLVDDLVEGLSGPIRNGQPRIIRNPLPRLGKVNLVVIWDKWKKFPLPSRSEMIMEACALVQAGMKEQIYLAIGRTTEEAISLGLLPYRIAVAEHRVPEAEREKVEEALADLGAVETSDGLQLRFERIDEAQDAMIRLGQMVPGPYWTIIQEVARED